MGERLTLLNTERLASGRTREWYAGRVPSSAFTGAAAIELIHGYTGEETQVDWPFSIPPSAIISAAEQSVDSSPQPYLESAAD